MKDIHARTPVDRVAARVVQPGEPYTPDKKVAQTLSDTPLPMRPFRRTGSNVNLTGRRAGRLTAVGVSSRRKANGTAIWVCRCDCGRYVERRAKALTNPKNDVDACDLCRHAAYLKRTSFYRTAGYNND